MSRCWRGGDRKHHKLFLSRQELSCDIFSMISLKCLLTESALFRRETTTTTGDAHQLLNLEISFPSSIW